MSNSVDLAPFRIRRARREDAETCGRICYDAFTAINPAAQLSPGAGDAGGCR